jgi:hypothetical protein
MATIDEYFAKKIIERDGRFDDDPRASRIVTYRSPEGNLNWAVIYPGEDQERYHKSSWCYDVKVIWEAKKPLDPEEAARYFHNKRPKP